MTTATAEQALRKHPFVQTFGEPQIAKLAALARETTFERDQVIFREGDECSEFYLIVSGLVALEIAAPGHTFRIQTLRGGDEFGWSAMLMGRGKHFQARALERVAALAFQGADLIKACQQDAAFGYAFMHRLLEVVSERLQATRLQLLDMYSPIAKKAGA
ncbi:Crp/Fnr family transcriptional regulator [Betaproteobacteria bacterium PRO7]|jgi:CRP-like cAMP-binding protein|nr:Crp/Fnr family transcriptional regulator [Betaproteobacteria bacterium PRO7]